MAALWRKCGSRLLQGIRCCGNGGAEVTPSTRPENLATELLKLRTGGGPDGRCDLSCHSGGPSS